MPEKPTFDKIAALRVLQAVVGEAAERVIFYSMADADEVTQARAAEGFYLLDVGGNKYQLRKTGSAVETVCRDFAVTDPDLLALIPIANKNNATGNLKGNGRLYPIVWALREAYQIGYSNVEVVERVLEMLDYYLKAKRQPVMDRESKVGLVVYLSLLSEFFYRGSRQFTLADLIWNVLVGEASEEDAVGKIREIMDWWQEVFRKAKEARKQAKHEAETISKTRFWFLGRLPGCLVHSDNSLLGRELKKKFALVIFRSSSGNVSILPSPRAQLDLSELAVRLNGFDQQGQRQEVWHFDEKSGTVLNGSPGWRASPTQLADEVIVRAVETFARRRPRR